MKLYTKKGDQGTTSILGKDKILKDHSRIEAYGTIDELNSVLGMAILHLSQDYRAKLQNIQSLLFELGSDLASQVPRNSILSSDVTMLEKLIDQIDENNSPLTSFILPGGSIAASWLHLARTVTRRAERLIVTLLHSEEINPQILIFVNRLSDLFFAWARYENIVAEVQDVEWSPRS